MEYNENAANVRTLIVSFVVAIFALIPLRFYEVSQMGVGSNVQVLGVREEVVLPVEYQEVVEAPVLEAPYNIIDGHEVDESQVLGENSNCLTSAEANDLIREATNVNLTNEEKDLLLSEIAAMQMCE